MVLPSSTPGWAPLWKGPHGCHPSVPLQAAVSEGALARWVRVSSSQAGPWRSRCFWPGHFEPSEKAGLSNPALGRGCVLVGAFWAFLNNNKGISSFPEPCSGPGASPCVQAAAGPAWLRVSPRPEQPRRRAGSRSSSNHTPNLSPNPAGRGSPAGGFPSL